MDISLKNISRVEEHAARLHYQWADRDSQAEALKVARARYYERMSEFGYKMPTNEDRPAVVEFATSVWLRLRVLAGFLRAEA